jgi:hypothetical protein
MYPNHHMRLLRVFPTVESVDIPTIDDAVLLRGVGSRVLVAGRDANVANVLTSYDPATATETPILGPDNEIEIYHLNPVDATTAMFDGLRFSDNKVVVGQVDVTTGQVTMVNALASRWEDFQTFAR